jgi:hypothetical protein
MELVLMHNILIAQVKAPQVTQLYPFLISLGQVLPFRLIHYAL